MKGSVQLSVPGPWGCEDEEGQGTCSLSSACRDLFSATMLKLDSNGSSSCFAPVFCPFDLVDGF